MINLAGDFLLLIRLFIVSYRIWQINDFSFGIMCSKSNLKYNILLLRDQTICLAAQCVDCVVYDKPGLHNRFTVVYIIRSVVFCTNIYVYSQVSEITALYSLVELYKSLNWCEREAWDLFGIIFDGHDNIRRLLLDYGFKGHPLRKDFPLSGYIEVNYNLDTFEIEYNKIELTQEYRSFIYSRLF